MCDLQRVFVRVFVGLRVKLRGRIGPSVTAQGVTGSELEVSGTGGDFCAGSGRLTRFSPQANPGCGPIHLEERSVSKELRRSPDVTGSFRLNCSLVEVLVEGRGSWAA